MLSRYRYISFRNNFQMGFGLFSLASYLQGILFWISKNRKKEKKKNMKNWTYLNFTSSFPFLHSAHSIRVAKRKCRWFAYRIPLFPLFARYIPFGSFYMFEVWRLRWKKCERNMKVFNENCVELLCVCVCFFLRVETLILAECNEKHFIWC